MTPDLETTAATTTAATTPYDRRRFLGYFSSLGLGSTLLPGVLWAKVSSGTDLTKATIAAAEEIAGLSFTDEQRELMVAELKDTQRQIAALHKLTIDNSVTPAVAFDPLLPGMPRPVAPPARRPAMVRERVPVMAVPSNLEALAFAPVTQLSELVRTRKVTSTALTRMYLDRIRKHDPVLQAVVTVTEERALRQAKAADEEIARGRYRGPLHGIPWGAKDLLAAKGYKTTWGAGPYKEQVIETDATVVRRLDDAGAVLVAKLTLGELAMGDVWFGGKTKNPWLVTQGSSGSSAGPGSATAAGLVGFSIGSETLGSISSPATRNGVTGLRPTFGRVPRTGAMALSWSMDKLGPMCRGVEDCALVLDAIHGGDGMDPSTIDAAFHWNARLPLGSIRVGYVKAAFDRPEKDPANPARTMNATKKWDDDALAALRGAGVNMVPVELPTFDFDPMFLILVAEGAAAFDEMTRSGKDKLLVQQGKDDWANTFRSARFIPAVEYINANRARTLLMQKWAELMKTVDVIVVPTNGTSQLLATNLTGQPAVILPHGFREDGTPVSLTFVAGLFEEAKLLRVAHAFQQATDWHRRVPKL
jgi:Asp-tRNA(Asn)/Glu-tRNA(Gln) amidotransferase A subunit family amidase